MKITEVKKLSGVLCACMFICMFSGLFQLQAAAAPIYTIEFRGGNHGSFGGETKVVVEKPYKETLTAIPEPDVTDSGYWFTGYQETVETAVTESKVYVAQYARLINAVEYRIQYVDADGVVLATQRTAYANAGETIHAYAAEIAGYTPDMAEKSATALEQGTVITFVYTPAGTVNPGVTDNGAGGAVDNGNAGGAIPDNGGNLQAVQDEPVPQGTQQLEDGGLTEIEEESVPLANPVINNKAESLWRYAMAAVAAAAGGTVLFLIVRKRRRQRLK